MAAGSWELGAQSWELRLKRLKRLKGLKRRVRSR